MRPAVERDDAGLVDDLVRDHHDARRLQDLVIVAVHHRDHRAGHAARDAAIEQAEVLRAVEGTADETAAHAARRAALSVGRQRGNPAVRRIDHEPCLPAVGDVQVLHPPRVGTADTPARQRVDDGLELRAPDLGELLSLDVFEAPAGESIGPLERRGVGVAIRKDAAEVGIAPRRAGQRPRLRRGPACGRSRLGPRADRSRQQHAERRRGNHCPHDA